MKTKFAKVTAAILTLVTTMSCASSALNPISVMAYENAAHSPNSIRLAATSDKVLSFNWSLITNVGRQASNSESCSCFALAYCRSILDGYAHSYSEYNKNGATQYNVWCMWSWGGYTKYHSGSKLGAYQAAYNQINSGKPVILFVTGSRTTWHWVTVVGYKSSADYNNLSASDFFIIDPCGKGNTYENLGDVGYSVKWEDNEGYAYLTADSGGVPLRGSDPEPVIPEKPVVNVTATDSSHDVSISYNACKNATHYDLRFYRASDDTKVWCVGQCDDGAAFGNLVTYTDTSYSHRFDPGDYYVTVAAVNNDTGKYNFSDKVNFSVIEAKKHLSIIYNANGGTTADDSAYYVSDDGMMFDNSSNKIYTTVWERGMGSENGLRNESSFKLQRDHYSFIGWSLSKDGSTTIFDQDDTSLTTKNLCPELNSDTTIMVYAIWNRVSQRGDLNEDDKVNYTDLDLLTKWLLGDTTVTIADPNAADLNSDGALNGIDLTLLKRQILIDESIVITMNKSSIKLNTQGESKTYQLSTSYINPDDVVWKSSNPSIATVSNGLVTAQKDGKVTITANVNGESLACSVEVITAFTESWSEPSKWDKTPIEGSATRRVSTEQRPESREISVNLAYCCARTKDDHIRQFYKDMIDPAALGLDTVYGVNTTQGVFGVPYITKSLAEIEQCTHIQNNERSYGDQSGYNRSGQVGYCFDNGCIWFEIGRNTETVMVTYYSYEDLIQTPVVYDNN